ncbi:hypothetical protein TNCV_4085651 [Trichonephila clavipes]|nr:hypothetical protein TNCV_4085651 [Trichonephila clavipes]
MACLYPPRSPTREAVCRSTANNQTRRLPKVHPEYSATASGRGSNPPPLICSTNPTAMSPKRLITSRLTEAGSLLPPVCSEAWAKGNAKVSPLFSSLRGLSTFFQIFFIKGF